MKKTDKIEEESKTIKALVDGGDMTDAIRDKIHCQLLTILKEAERLETECNMGIRELSKWAARTGRAEGAKDCLDEKNKILDRALRKHYAVCVDPDTNSYHFDIDRYERDVAKAKLEILEKGSPT